MTNKITYLQRFREVVRLITNEFPPLDLSEQWLNFENDKLQEWVINALGESWPQGIAVIDAAMIMADQPKEGLNLEIDYSRPKAIDMEIEIRYLKGTVERLENNIEALEHENEELKEYIENLINI